MPSWGMTARSAGFMRTLIQAHHIYWALQQHLQLLLEGHRRKRFAARLIASRQGTVSAKAKHWRIAS